QCVFRKATSFDVHNEQLCASDALDAPPGINFMPDQSRLPAVLLICFAMAFAVVLGVAGLFYFRISHSKTSIDLSGGTELTYEVVIDGVERDIAHFETIIGELSKSDPVSERDKEQIKHLAAYIESRKAVLNNPAEICAPVVRRRIEALGIKGS